MCLLNLNLLPIITPKYFIAVTCSKGLLFKYTLISFVSFRFLLDINKILDFSSLNVTLLLLDHAVILLTSQFEKFSASLTVFPLTASIRSSANATALVRLVNLRFSRDLYRVFQNPGQQDPCSYPLLTSFHSNAVG